MRKAKRSTLVTSLDTIFSKYIRLRYADHAGMVECFTCGHRDHYKNVDAGHFQSRKHYATRWNEDNVQVQCKKCNMYYGGEQFKYAKKLGEEKAEELWRLAHETVKISDYELREMIQLYKEKVKQLESR